MARMAARRAERRELLADAAEVDHLVERWRRVCEGSELVHRVDTVSGPTVVTPQIVDVSLGPPTTMIIQLLPGMLRGDVVRIARRLAGGMGASALRVEQRGPHYVSITLLLADPLAGLVAPFPPTRSVVESPPVLGVSETGDPIRLDLAGAAHLIWQGGSGSGKSTAAYALLAQVRDSSDVVVTGADPTGLLLGPWVQTSTTRSDSRPDLNPPGDESSPGVGESASPIPSPALGTADPEQHIATLEALVAVLDDRVYSLPAGRDSVDLTDPATPVVLVVMEEFPGTLRVLDQHDKKAGARARAAVARIAAEGRKAGLRLLIMAQRADAAVIDGYTRAQASHRVSFRVDSSEALRMLHADPEDALTDHVTAEPGVALLTAPGQPLTRFRAPYVPYRQYVDAITGREATA